MFRSKLRSNYFLHRVLTSWLSLASLMSPLGYPLLASAQVNAPATSPGGNASPSSPQSDTQAFPQPNPQAFPPANPQSTQPDTAPSSTIGPDQNPANPNTGRKPLSWPLPPLVKPTVTPAIAEVKDEGYTLGAGDVIRIDIFNVPEYSGPNQVLADGSLNLPLIGTVSVKGMTLKQASAELANRYTRFLKRPLITITVTTPRPATIAVAGEVNRPGSYLATAQSGSIPTVTRMIQLAGGITRAADIKQVEVRRPQPLNAGPDQVITIDLWALLRQGDLRQDIILRDGDSVIIPTITNLDLNDATQLASTSFTGAQVPIQVAIVGEVNRPGPYRLQGGEARGITVTAAIAQAGGIRQEADIRKVQVRRLTKAGPEQLVDINLWNLLTEGDLKQDIQLQEGDTIVVPTATALTPDEVTRLATTSFSPATITVNVVGEVVRPGALQLPPNTPLNQAILAAGGFNTRAQSGSAELIRLNPNGSVSQRGIGVNFAQGVSDEGNPPLRNNDTVVVGKSAIAGATDTLGLLFAPLAPLTGVLGFLRLFGL